MTGKEPVVFIQAYGCQMNKLDAELVVSAMLDLGYGQTSDMESADAILFCTCSVREHAEERVYSNVGKLKHLKRRRPETVIGVLGCMAQKDGRRVLDRAPHVDIVCGTRAFPRIGEFVEAVRRGEGPILALDEDRVSMPARKKAARPHRARAFLAIMRGCDNFCSYCIVPYVRGREHSRPMDEIEAEARALVDDGVREITLLGQNVNAYGKSFGRPGALADLLPRLDGIDGLERVRFVTSHPKSMTRAIFEAIRDLPSVCESVHMPAQTGSDRVLAAMRRGYTVSQYRELVAEARETVPGIAIASDFIVGFPGETDPDFRQTAELLRETRFQTSYVFKYSPRPGAQSADLEDTVPADEKKRRNNVLLDIQEQVGSEEHERMIGDVVEVLVEGASKKDGQKMTGRTRTNRIVHFGGNRNLEGEIVHVCISRATPLTLSGVIVE